MTIEDPYIKLLESERERLLAELKIEKDKCEMLTGLLLKQAGLLIEETVVAVPETTGAIGKEPWAVKQRRLEKAFRKYIPEEVPDGQ